MRQKLAYGILGLTIVSIFLPFAFFGIAFLTLPISSEMDWLFNEFTIKIIFVSFWAFPFLITISLVSLIFYRVQWKRFLAIQIVCLFIWLAMIGIASLFPD